MWNTLFGIVICEMKRKTIFECPLLKDLEENCQYLFKTDGVSAYIRFSEFLEILINVSSYIREYMPGHDCNVMLSQL